MLELVPALALTLMIAAAPPQAATAAVPHAQEQTQEAEPGTCANATDPMTDAGLDTLLADASRLLEANRSRPALACYERALSIAQNLSLPDRIATAGSGVGRGLHDLGRYPDAVAQYERTLTQYRELNDATGEARTLRRLGYTLSFIGQKDRARKVLLDAKVIFEQTNDRVGLAETYATQLSTNDPPEGPEKDALRQEALRLARESNAHIVECSILHGWGDDAFTRGRYAEANTRLLEAFACYDGSTSSLSRTGAVLVSLGRVQRAHGRFGAALQYYKRALELHERAQDDLMIVQSLNAVAVGYGYLGQPEEAAAYYQRALDLAKEIGSEQTIGFLEGQLGNVRRSNGDLAGAIPLLESALKRDLRNPSRRQAALAEAYARAGRQAEALPLANIAVEHARKQGAETLLNALRHRENVHYFAGRLEDAQADLVEAFTVVEELRRNTIATDFMKRGFGTWHQSLYSASVALYVRKGMSIEALQTAERARARAFLDLLATRSPASASSSGSAAGSAAASSPPSMSALATAPASTAAPSSSSSAPASSLPSPPASPPEASSLSALLAATRGGAGMLPADLTASDVSVRMPNAQAADAPTEDDMRATAKRLKSTLLIYWVGDNATYMWVVTPAGRVHAAHVEIAETKVRNLVATAAASIEGAQSGFSALGNPHRPWRELHQVLIAPIKAFLPTAPDSLLTIVPHGPLFQVSFAALQDEHGRYLLERYRLHYTPSVGVLEYTSTHAPATANAAARHAERALLIGDPAPLPHTAGDEPMPALPWARREVEEIGHTISPNHAEIVTGQDARESAVRARIEQADLLHFATHGVVQQEESFSSFLALSMPTAAGADAAPPTQDDDGKLTADEVYRLHLRARLVVLSACRTALGALTGDGVIGFTRAFLYAGASSVIATSWDVPDEAGYEVMRRFYLARNGVGRTRTTVQSADALRTAQLSVLASLRKGTFKTQTPSGDVVLQEHPLLWAGFLIVGEP